MESIEKFVKRAVWVVVILMTAYGAFSFSWMNSWQGVPSWAINTIIMGVVALELAFAFRRKKKILLVFVCSGLVLLGTGGIGKYMYHMDQKIPRVTQNDDELFWKYAPFSEDFKGVKLDSTLKLTENLPRIDGATALYPIYASIVHNVYPVGEYLYYIYNGTGGKVEVNEEESLVVCSKTPNAYQRLIEGKTDIIFVGGPSEKQLEAAKQAGVEFEMTPIGRESFVFFVNVKNPVNGLTLEQIQKIYTGEITNWEEVGGNDEEIRPFQRPEGSGSQSALQRLMGDLKLIAPLEEDIVTGMGGIIHQTADYKNYKNAIGYSFRFYSTELVKDNQIKLLAVNGIEPTRDNILNQSYPITNNFYAITLKGHTNPNIDALLDWITSSQGQQIIDEVGYVSLKK